MGESAEVKKVRATVEEYCHDYRIEPVFDVSRLYDIQNEWKTKQFPHANERGCYIYYDENQCLLYIGKVSLNHTLGGRIVNYFRLDKVSGKRIAQGIWSAPPVYLQTIKVHQPWESPSLEEFLLFKLQPANNTRKGRPTPG